eukprot:1146389-Pelagomonas_calceolata.AAC.2
MHKAILALAVSGTPSALTTTERREEEGRTAYTVHHLQGIASSNSHVCASINDGMHVGLPTGALKEFHYGVQSWFALLNV